MKQNLVALISGVLFDLGLGLSQMIDRERVLGFLDVTGVWDPTLLFVLFGAVAVTVIAFRFVLRFPHPLYEEKFYLPTQKNIDRTYANTIVLPPDPPSLGGVNPVPPRFGGLGGRMRKS